MSKKSKSYEIGGSKYSFDFDSSSKLVGIQKADDEGDFDNSYLNPNTSEFGKLVADTGKTEALNAYNIAKYGSNKNGYEDTVTQATSSELNDFYNKKNKKKSNAQSIDPPLSKNPIYSNSSLQYQGGSNYKGNRNVAGTDKSLYAYPFDIDPSQDHLKIQKWEYVRPNINQSKPNQGPANQDVNVAGDSVKGSKLQGSVLLPMPKVVDVNGADWGENKITAFGLGALGAAEGLGKLVGLTPGLTEEERGNQREALNKLKSAGQFGSGFGSEKEFENFRKTLGQVASVSVTSGIAGLAGNALGTNISPDTFLARTSGAVLNPNAEMLFQGPVIRDFNFTFLMIARSEDEGKQIRRIIKWFKKGMAPKFRNTTLIKSPDIFTLEYRNAGGLLKTVNRFNPGGLALTTVNVDYAPSGYWSAYRDSQPVAVKMDLNFTELRPIYQKDQEDDDVFRGLDSVGF